MAEAPPRQTPTQHCIGQHSTTDTTHPQLFCSVNCMLHVVRCRVHLAEASHSHTLTLCCIGQQHTPHISCCLAMPWPGCSFNCMLQVMRCRVRLAEASPQLHTYCCTCQHSTTDTTYSQLFCSPNCMLQVVRCCVHG
jgi:hypothetical protein